MSASQQMLIAAAKSEFSNALADGYHHYWEFHDNETLWAKAGCPVCKLKERRRTPMIKHHFTDPNVRGSVAVEACCSANQSHVYSLPSCSNPLKTTCGNCKRTKIWKAAFIEYERAGETG